MRRSLITAVFIFSGLGASMAEAGETGPTKAEFNVQAYGLKVGEVAMTGDLNARSYSVAASFATTGLIRLFKDMGFKMQANGRLRGGAFRPRHYSEEVNTGNRTSSAQIRYDHDTPVLVSGNVSDGEVAPLDPAGETGSVDPLTVMFMVLRDQPDATLCQTDEIIFDGGRRTRVILTGRTEQHDEVTCTGQYRRLAGYPAQELKTRPVVPLTISYASGENGMMQAQRALLRTTYGPVGLVRR